LIAFPYLIIKDFKGFYLRIFYTKERKVYVSEELEYKALALSRVNLKVYTPTEVEIGRRN
jgi:hypothetical protein